VERLRADVVHFTIQTGVFATDIPSIYQPHDLQHLHLPEFFTTREIEERELRYRAGCEQAAIVAVMSKWGRQDIIDNYDVDPDRVKIVPWAPILHAYPEPTAADLARVRKERDLPHAFILYPATTWPHKNHVVLFEAMAALKHLRGPRIELVCTGTQNENYPVLEKAMRKLGILDRVRFTGFLAPIELRAIYRLATALVFPSLFEGWGMPVVEAFSEGLPVACSNVTMLPALVGDAGFIFSPRDVGSVAGALDRIWRDDVLRQVLVNRGRARARDFTWEKTARLLRGHYRRLAGHSLSPDDRELLASPPLV
jgi:glycosyltransferase involved in cell wall biosynthesis